MQVQEKLARRWAEYRQDPVLFVRTFWPEFRLAPYQKQILESVRDNNETWVPSANKMGKTFIAAQTALWWFLTRNSKVVTSSTTEYQLVRILWGEIGHLLQQMKLGGYRFRLERKHLCISLAREEGQRDSQGKYYLIGQVTAQVESFQGHHLEKMADGTPTVLFIFEEASGLEREFYEAATSQAHRLLAIGNPLRARGIFFEKCRAKDERHPDHLDRLFRKVIHVSGDDSPNVQYARRHRELGRPGKPRIIVPGILTFEEYQERLHNWAPDKVRTRLLGQFEDESEEKFFPVEWVDQAQQLGSMLREHTARRRHRHRFGAPYALGVDVAQGGRDETVWVVLGRFGVREIVARQTPNTSAIAGRTLQLMRRYRIRDCAVAFDTGGGGKQIADYLRDRQGLENLSDIAFGAKAFDSAEYPNRRAELYGELRKALEPCGRLKRMLRCSPSEWTKKQWCVALPPDDGLLRDELLVLPKLHDSEGRLRLPPKQKRVQQTTGPQEPTIRELLGGRSPDRADALVLAYYAWQRLREWQSLERVHGPLIY